MNISVTPEQKAFVQGLVAEGDFGSDSEVIRHGLRLIEEERRQKHIEEKLLEGLNSGDPIEVNDAFWAKIRHEVLGDRSSET